MTDLLARREHFPVAGSTNDVVRDWLANGVPEVCLASADEQTAGRGRDGRAWLSPPRVALLLSLGYRPTWLTPERAWQLAATVSMAMANAAEDVAALTPGSIRLKWPNDLVTEGSDGVRKVAGVLGESDGLGTDDPRVVIGIGVNTDWPADAFPPDLAASMTSLRVLSAAPRIDHHALLEAFLARLEHEIRALRRGHLDVAAWADRQVTTGRLIELIGSDGAVTTTRAEGVDPASGALIVADDAATDGRRAVVVGEIRHVRLPAVASAGV
ncbi:MAG TPA: biotin--[acetyl-CoA-carboxylase] ligase [Candidatus Limnocylindrales bacterium]|nr:biotin--[acetyl-CoA-carboxylase] ligase [Candidatus Limnocylindrales bacterium]